MRKSRISDKAKKILLSSVSSTAIFGHVLPVFSFCLGMYSSLIMVLLSARLHELFKLFFAAIINEVPERFPSSLLQYSPGPNQEIGDGTNVLGYHLATLGF